MFTFAFINRLVLAWRNVAALWLASTIACVGVTCWLVCGSCQLADGQDDLKTGLSPVSAYDGSLDVALLRQIEGRALPAAVKQGPPRFGDLPSYYWAENEELRERLELAKQHFKNESSQPYRALTLIAGTAGVGKTFIKQDIFSKDGPEKAICKFDIKELLEDWKAKGLVEERPDLHCGDVVLSTLLAIKAGQPTLLREYLESKSACFFVIDSLDEIHPDNYSPVLNQIEQFVQQSERPFLHVVVLGRPLAYRDYWRERDVSSGQQIELFMLHPPRFLTTGDLMVSSWNYHTWRYQLRWESIAGNPQIMPFDVYADWIKHGYPDSFLNRRVSYDPNQSMNPHVRSTVRSWAQQYPVVNSMLSNLAGNGIVREIAERFGQENRPFDEREVMEDYLAKWLERHTRCENRPSSAKPEHLDLYLQIVEEVAVRYLQDGEVDLNGFFTVSQDDHIEVNYDGKPMRFPVTRILDRSGLKYLDPRERGAASYRFEPAWLHRLLVTKHNEKFRENDH